MFELVLKGKEGNAKRNKKNYRNYTIHQGMVPMFLIVT